MADIQLKTTLGTDTGTGKLMNAYEMTGPRASYIENGAVSVPDRFVLSRTEPKPTREYAGHGRAEARYSSTWTDTAGKQWPVTYVVQTSIPDGMSAADKAAFVLRCVLATRDSVVQAALAVRTIPQS